MSNISKVAANNGLAKADANDGDIRECVSVRGIVIDLADVSHALRREYHAAARQLGRHTKAKANFEAVGERILAEQLPHLAMKYLTPRFSGKQAAEKLLGIGLKK
jgi:hypothetical protein